MEATIIEILTGRKFPQSAKEIWLAIQLAANDKSIELKSVKKVLAKMVKSDSLETKKKKAYHRVHIQGKFGGAAMGVHYELHYSIKPA